MARSTLHGSEVRAGPCLGQVMLALACSVFLLAATGCQSVKYRALEAMGVEKRDIMADRVEGARDAQDDAREQFTTALERFRATVEVDGGDLEDTYDRLDSEFERSKARAKAVTDRIDSVENVADDLFEEWEEELDLYTDAGLRSRSQRILDQTRIDYRGMLSAMRRAEGSMQPVLGVFQDQVLFLKHNLNARAVASLRQELAGIERMTGALLEDMDAAIAEADAFLSSLEG